MENYPIDFSFEEQKKSNMSDLQKKVLHQTIQLLIGMGCDFAIIDLDDEKHGNLEVIKQKSRTRTQKFAFYVSPILDQITVGKPVVVPCKDYKIEELQANICARAGTKWGLGSVTTSINRQNNTVEVLRIK
jgi:hypothetical protein